MNLREAILDLLFPPKCPFCGTIVEQAGLCQRCEKTLPWVEPEKRIWKGQGNLRCAAPLWYEAQAREGLLRMKFRGVSAAAEPMGALLAQCAAEEFGGEFDTVTWVPVSKKRRRKRGYDQSRLLAEAACKVWGIRAEQLLVKPVDTPAQSGLTEPAARRANVLGVYEAERADVAGKRILLVDDICTSGATLTECARVLEAAGAAEVVCVTLARAREKKKYEKSENS